jgi:predicted metalloprotease with PDZ domain
MTGNSEEGSFLCLASPDRYNNADPLTVLATHECLHFYLGGAIAASPEPPFRNSPDLIWLMEGITEYLTFKLLGNAGVLSPRDLSEIRVRKEKEFLDSPGASRYSLADAARRMGNLDIYSLVYSRGYLVGSLLDQGMTEHCGPGTFEAALRELFEEFSYYRTGEVVTPEMVREVFVSHCEIAGELIDRYADGRDPPLLPPSPRRLSLAAQ